MQNQNSFSGEIKPKEKFQSGNTFFPPLKERRAEIIDKQECPYTAKLVNGSSISEKENLEAIKKAIGSNAKVLVGISVGQDYHENGHLTALLRALKSDFNLENYYLIIGDSLQRYSKTIQTVMALNNTEVPVDHYNQVAINEGQSWITRNKDFLRPENKSTPTPMYIRWDDLISSKKGSNNKSSSKPILRGEYYSQLLIEYQKMFDNNHPFKKAVEDSSEIYLKQKKEKWKSDNKQVNIANNPVLKKAEDLSRQYILEEVAVFMSLLIELWQQTGKNTHYLAYPGPTLPALTKACEMLKNICQNSKDLKSLQLDADLNLQVLQFDIKKNQSNQNKTRSTVPLPKCEHPNPFFPDPEKTSLGAEFMFDWQRSKEKPSPMHKKQMEIFEKSAEIFGAFLQKQASAIFSNKEENEFFESEGKSSMRYGLHK